MANRDTHIQAGLLPRGIWLAAAIASVMLHPGAVTGEPVDQQAGKLMAECKTASGGAALDRPQAFHEHGTFVRDGIGGIYDEYGDLRGLRTVGVHIFTDHTDRGCFDGKSAWHQGPDGVVHRTADPAMNRDARTDAYITIGGYFSPDRFPAVFRARGRRTENGRTYDVVETIPAGGSMVDLWLDTASHRLGRITTDAHRNAFADNSDNREIDGTWIGFHSRQVESGHHLELRLESYRYVPLNPARFVAPGT
jgi:hypothetical protein